MTHRPPPDGAISTKPAARELRGGVDHIAQAKKLRDRAEECRTVARMMTSEANAAVYLRFAEGYDALAEQREQIARDIAELKINVQPR